MRSHRVVWLARDSSANNVGLFKLCSVDIEYISNPFNVRPVVRENALAKRIYLDLADTLHSGAFKAKIETALTDASEKT